MTPQRFVIRQGEAAVLAKMLEYLSSAVDDSPQEVRIQPYQSKRNLEQNAAYWAMLSDVAAWRYETHGEATDATVLHEHMKRLFQPVIGCYTSQLKVDGHWREVEITVHQSTTQNTVAEMSLYLDKVTSYWTAMGMQFKDVTYAS